MCLQHLASPVIGLCAITRLGDVEDEASVLRTRGGQEVKMKVGLCKEKKL